jgi:transaldolase
MAKEGISIDPGDLNWAGISVFRQSHALFRERGFRSKLLVAAYRHHLHWSELAGPGVVQSIPYTWWKRFDSSEIEPVSRIGDRPAEDRTRRLLRHFPDFAKAYEERALHPKDFAAYGPTVHTLNQFLSAAEDLYGLVRERMLALGL